MLALGKGGKRKFCVAVDREARSVKPAPLQSGIDGTECYGCRMGWIRLVVGVVSVVFVCVCSNLASELAVKGIFLVGLIVVRGGERRIVKALLH